MEIEMEIEIARERERELEDASFYVSPIYKKEGNRGKRVQEEREDIQYKRHALATQ